MRVATRHAACCLLWLGVAQAADLPPAPPLVDIARQGYAFEHPRILARQRLFGVFHGVSLLADTCVEREKNRDAVLMAQLDWVRGLEAFLADTHSELARFYYGARAAEAVSQHLVRALNLREALDLPEEQLGAACDTLPEVLQKPRYALADRYVLEKNLAQLALAIRAESFALACQTDTEDAQPVVQAFTEWQQHNADAAAVTRTRLADAWPAQQLEGDMESWQAAQRKRLGKPATAQCAVLPQWLASPAAQLAQVFALLDATVVTLQDAEHPAAPVAVALAVNTPATAVAMDMPEAQQPPSPVSDAIPQTVESEVPSAGVNLIDWLMSLFNERKTAEPATAVRD